MTEATLPGYFPPDFKHDNFNDAPKVDVSEGADAGTLPEDQWPTFMVHNARELQNDMVHDASELQNDNTELSRESAGRVFHSKGFCCLPHPSKVKDWNEDYFKGHCCMGQVKGTGTDISNIYADEVEEMIRNVLLPEYNIVSMSLHNGVLRRGPGSKNNFYGTGVHQDYGLTLEDYKQNLGCFDKSGYQAKSVDSMWAKPEVKGCMFINFWRPILNYTKENPLLTKPLAVCDPASVRVDDTVHTGLDAGAINGVPGQMTDQMGLKYSPDHQWYYYPRMHNDEVMAFKQFEYWKSDPADRTQVPVRGCFHSAFVDPNTPDDAAPRTSCEYRVRIYLGSKKTAEELLAPPWKIPAPLYPKAGAEYGKFAMGMGVVFLIIQAFTGKCPSQPSFLSYLLAFGIVSLIGDLLKFHFSLQTRKSSAARYPVANGICSFVGIGQIGLGIWGIVLILSNLNLYSNASAETCEIGVLIAGTIPAVIIAVVILVLLGMGLKTVLCKMTVLCKKPEPKGESAQLL